MGDKPRMEITFAPDGAPVIKGNFNWVQMLVVADVLKMEGEGMYMSMRIASAPSGDGKVIDIARTLPAGLPDA